MPSLIDTISESAKFSGVSITTVRWIVNGPGYVAFLKAVDHKNLQVHRAIGNATKTKSFSLKDFLAQRKFVRPPQAVYQDFGLWIGDPKQDAVPEKKEIPVFADGSACYVCLDPFQDGQAIRDIGKGLRRHEDCSPGSSVWLKSPAGKASPFRELYLEGALKKS